ncbi:hypothetical protein ABZ705_26610, partial [Streptomyces sp. NPDC006984]|uniref:hypothetical protein n=1 Tax=Streptomyces sp. NPDC006984 TaxID=3155463 RepID=UPI0033C20798
MPSSRSRRRPPRPPAVTRAHAPLTGEFAADPAVCHQAFQTAVDFGFVAVDAIADLLPHEESLALVKRLGFCDCGRLALDDDDGPCPRVVDTFEPGPGRGRVGGIFYGDEGLLA